MKFIRLKDWVTPGQNAQGVFGDCFPPGVHLITFLQAVSYPIAAAVSGVGAIVTRGK